MIKELLIINTVAIAVCIVIIAVLTIWLMREKKKNFDKAECIYTHTTKSTVITTDSGLGVNYSLTGWFCSHCGNHEENIYVNMQYCPHCGRCISKFCR